MSQLNFNLKQIGVIRSPYKEKAPYQPVDEAEGDFRIIVDSQYANGLYKLSDFHYIYVVYFIHRLNSLSGQSIFDISLNFTILDNIIFILLKYKV